MSRLGPSIIFGDLGHPLTFNGDLGILSTSLFKIAIAQLFSDFISQLAALFPHYCVSRRKPRNQATLQACFPEAFLYSTGSLGKALVQCDEALMTTSPSKVDGNLEFATLSSPQTRIRSHYCQQFVLSSEN